MRHLDKMRVEDYARRVAMAKTYGQAEAVEAAHDYSFSRVVAEVAIVAYFYNNLLIPLQKDPFGKGIRTITS